VAQFLDEDYRHLSPTLEREERGGKRGVLSPGSFSSPSLSAPAILYCFSCFTGGEKKGERGGGKRGEKKKGGKKGELSRHGKG